MDKRKLTVLISFDFSIAFDTVSHLKIFDKLREVGCSETVICWFVSYIRDRKLAARLENDEHEERLDTDTGLPQFIVLGPLLFLLFINIL